VLEDVLVRGAIDLLYRTDDGTGIVDFKTDAVTAEEALDVGERYRLQIGIYAYAVDRAEYALPASAAIHFLTPGVTVPIDCSQNWLGEIENTLTVAIRSITEGKFPRKETGRCRTCLYRHVCGMGDSGV
jgi:CRISPR/Cas system-associated exonuclease Cas4 (RecB family)